jgi:predicted Zn-dependent peptidase
VALPHLHTVALAVFVKVGSRFEMPADNGLSHFVEHMLFRGTAAYPTSLALNMAVESLGGTLHAETGRDLSLFHICVEPDQVLSGLALLGEILGRPRFDDIELERSIILEEMNEDYDEGGVEVNCDDIARGLLFGDHALGQRVLGPRGNVERFTPADVRRHFDRHYCARNMLLCVAGPVAPRDVAAGAEAHLGHLCPGAPVDAPPALIDQDQTAPRYRYVADSGSQASVNLVFRSVPDMDPRYVDSMALLRAVDDGMSTPLHYELCDRKGLAYALSASIEPLADAALFEVSGATAQAKVPALVRGVLDLLGRFRTELLGEAELIRIKRRYHYDLVSSMDDSLAMASWFGGIALYYPPPGYGERLAEMSAVTAEHIRAAAERVFRPENLAVAVVGPLSRARQGEVRELVTRWR